MVAPVIGSATRDILFTSATSVVITAPSGIADDDLLVIIFGPDGDASNPSISSAGAAFTRQVNLEEGTVELNIFTAIAASESGNYTVNWTGSETGVVHMYRITGALTSDFLQIGTTDTQNADPCVSLSMTPDADDVLMFSCYCIDRGRSTDDQADDGVGWTTETHEVHGAGGGTGLGVSTKTIASQSASLNGSQNLSSVDGWATVQIAWRSVAPAAPAAVQPKSILMRLQTV